MNFSVFVTIEKKILPYFGNLKINAIKNADIIKWQNELLAYTDEKGNPYSPVYLKTLHNQLSAIFNHAVKFYELKSNPARTVGNMGSETSKEMDFWTKEEYLKFADVMMDKPVSFYAFEILYWTGIRVGDDCVIIGLNRKSADKYRFFGLVFFLLKQE